MEFEDRKKVVIFYTVAFLLGLIGMAVYLMGYHLYLDHRFVDDIRMQIIQSQNKQPASKP